MTYRALPRHASPTPDWAELYAEHQGAIHAYMFRQTHDSALAEDLTAEVFVKAIDATARGQGSRTTIRGWLFRIAHNLVIDTYRRCNKRKSISIDDVACLPAPYPDPVQAGEAAVNTEIVRLAMQCLPSGQALVLRLRYLEGYKFSEIAGMMGRSQGAVKALQHRGRASLLKILTRWCAL